jgi:hypothetical protein
VPGEQHRQDGAPERADQPERQIEPTLERQASATGYGIKLTGYAEVERLELLVAELMRRLGMDS